MCVTSLHVMLYITNLCIKYIYKESYCLCYATCQVLMKSPEVVQQLKKYQSRRRKQFLLRCQAARHNEKKSCHPDRDRCSENIVSAEKPVDASCTRSAAFSISSSLSKIAEPVTSPVIMSAAVTSVTESAYCFGSEIWSKSDSAFTSFTSVSNSQNAVL